MRKISELKTAKERRNFLETELNIDLSQIGSTLIDDEVNIHCENLIGATSLPVGVGGPITIKYNGKLKDYFIPLATTEGALVASVNRGCKAISASGGAIIAVESNGVTRGPVFETSGIEETLTLKKWIQDNFVDIKKKAELTSHHVKLKKIGIRHTSNRLFARFYYDTDDAMGMNMVTMATAAACQLIEVKTGIPCQAVAGNFDIDKKAAWINVITGRGKQLFAEATIPSRVVKNVLKTDTNRLYSVWLSKCIFGSYMSGSIGFNNHFANIVAGFFAATGQDLAHTVEGSLGITTTKVMPDGALYISVYLPSIMIGTVGGGTMLKTQKEAQMITGAKKSNELATALAGAVLAGELSLLASLAEGSLVRAHQRLGR